MRKKAAGQMLNGELSDLDEIDDGSLQPYDDFTGDTTVANV